MKRKPGKVSSKEVVQIANRLLDIPLQDIDEDDLDLCLRTLLSHVRHYDEDEITDEFLMNEHWKRFSPHHNCYVKIITKKLKADIEKLNEGKTWSLFLTRSVSGLEYEDEDEDEDEEVQIIVNSVRSLKQALSVFVESEKASNAS